jgi:hypothetical protein
MKDFQAVFVYKRKSTTHSKSYSYEDFYRRSTRKHLHAFNSKTNQKGTSGPGNHSQREPKRGFEEAWG